tara:strand:- start:2561 stop:3400 length:840 start_codon:yes stop_codon:yes gene_type:complete
MSVYGAIGNQLEYQVDELDLKNILAGQSDVISNRIASFAAQLPVGKKLTGLDFSCNPINKDTVGLICVAIQDCAALGFQYINLGDCHITAESLPQLLQAVNVAKIPHLILNGNKLDESGFQIVFDSLDNITELTLQHSRLQDDLFLEVAPSIAQAKNLRKLDLRHNELSDKSFACIADKLLPSTGLVSLWLDNNPVSESGLKYFLKKLKVADELPLICLDINHISSAEDIKHDFEEVVRRQLNPILQLKQLCETLAGTSIQPEAEASQDVSSNLRRLTL